MSRSVVSGPLAVLTKETDGEIFISAMQAIPAVVSSIAYSFQRIAQGAFVLRATASGSATALFGFNISTLLKKVGADPLAATGAVPAEKPGKSGERDIRGFQLRTVTPVYRIATANLSAAATATLNRVVQANATAPTVTQPSTTTGTMATNTNTSSQVYVTALTVDTPYIVGNNTALVHDCIEVSAPMVNTGVFDLYGIFLGVHYNVL